MNEMPRIPFVPARPGTTQAGDGLPRRRWSADELQRMLQAGIIEHGERFELIGGDLVAMAAKGRHHEVLKVALNAHWMKIRPPELMIAPETALCLGEHEEPEPDFIVYPATILAPDVRGDTVLLVVEVADSSLAYDRRFKATRYAAYGVREYWVIDAVKRVTTVHREPEGSSYRSVEEHKARKLLKPRFAPELALRLTDLKLG